MVAFASLLLATTGSGIFYPVGVAIVPNAMELGVDVASASLPYGAAMIGMGLGGIFMGWLSDKRGPFLPAAIGTVCISVGCYWISLT